MLFVFFVLIFICILHLYLYLYLYFQQCFYKLRVWEERWGYVMILFVKFVLVANVQYCIRCILCSLFFILFICICICIVYVFYKPNSTQSVRWAMRVIRSLSLFTSPDVASISPRIYQCWRRFWYFYILKMFYMSWRNILKFVFLHMCICMYICRHSLTFSFYFPRRCINFSKDLSMLKKIFIFLYS